MKTCPSIGWPLAMVSLALLLFVAPSIPTRAEVVVSVFTGLTLTENNDLRVRQPGGTALTFHDVPYEGRDFEEPLYYGARLSYFLSERSHWGFGVEFIHAKTYLKDNATVLVTGTRAGEPVHDRERIADTVAFSMSHGMNFVFADGIYRWFLGERDKEFLGRLQPYIGGGIGVVVPHVETRIGGTSFQEYQLHGPAFQALAGLNFDLLRHWSLFAEYKFTYVDLDLGIPGGSIRTASMTHHLVSGISFRF